jgi:PAS domain S-box-containing protein
MHEAEKAVAQEVFKNRQGPQVERTTDADPSLMQMMEAVDEALQAVPAGAERNRLAGQLDQLRQRVAQYAQASRQEAEAAQNEAQSKVRLILESITDAFVSFNRQWHYTFVNEQAARLLQKPREDLLGKHLWEEVFPSQVGTLAYRELQRAMADQVPVVYEDYNADLNAWFEVRVYPTQEGLALYFQDISDRKQAELVLVEQKRLLELIASGKSLEECLSAICAAVAALNPQVRACFLLTDPQRQSFPRSITPDFPPTLGAGLKDAPINDLCIGTCGEAVYSGQPTTCADIANDDRWSQGWRDLCIAHGILACHSTPVPGADGLPLGSLMLCFDQPRMPTSWEYQLAEFGTQIASIAFEHERATLARVESEHRYRTLFDSIDQGFCFCEMLFDQQGQPIDYRFLEVNPSFEALTGLVNPVGKTARELVPNLEPFWFEIYGQVALTGSPVRFEHESVAMNRWFDVNAFPVEGATGKVAILFTNITQRKRFEQERERFLAVGSDLLVIARADGYFQWVSPAFERILGWTPAEMTCRPWNEFVHPDDIEATIAASHAVFWANQSVSLENRYRHRDGSYRWFLWSGQFYPEEQVLYGAAIDISDRKQAEEALRESEARFRQMADTAPTLVWMSGTDKLCNYFNQSWLNFTGRTMAQELGNGWTEGVHPDDFQRCLHTYTTAFDARQPFEMDYRLRRFDGEYRWIFDAGAPRFTPEGQFLGYIGSCFDIHDRKQAEAEREQRLANERHYVSQLQGLTEAALTMNSALAVEDVLGVITDQAAAIIGAHQAVTSLTIDHNWAKAITTIYLSEKYAQWRTYSEDPDGSGIYAYLCQLNRPMRMTQAELESHPHWRGFGKEAANHPPLRGWLAAPLMGRNGQNIGIIQLSDKYEGEFTEADEAILVQLAQMASVAAENAQLYEAEQQARSAAEAAREEAQAANRIKDEFLAVLSHELRSPLNPILGWSRVLQTGKLTEAQIQQALSTIERNAKLQSELIDDLLDVSRILQGKLSLTASPVHLGPIIGAALETVRLSAEAKSIPIETHLDPDVGLVSGDPTRLQQIVWNLLSNAVKFTPAGGRVTVRLERAEGEGGGEGVQGMGYGVQGTDTLPAPYTLPSPPYAQITVSDTGKGISADFLPYVFDYFRQASSATTREFGGLGLGLAIVRHLVELHGGTIGAESPGEGLGATFTVTLPIMTRLPEPSSNSVEVDGDARLGGLHILVVDDDADSREFVIYVLEEAGARVTAADSAAAALVALAYDRPEVLLSDVGMPEMDGYMLLQQVRALPPEAGGQIPAIALTAFAGEINQQKALQAGFQQHLSKPVDPKVLIQSIIRLVDREQNPLES